MAMIMRVIGYPFGGACPHAHEFVVSMDFEAHDGRGALITSPDRAKAKHFADVGEAMEFWKTSPRCHPTRETDGKLNRPLTAFTVALEQVPH